MIQTRQQLKQWFRKFAFPTQEQFWDWMDSYWHKDEEIPAGKISGLQQIFDGATSGFSEAMANKQDKTDTNLQTDDKTVVGAVNELIGRTNGIKNDIDSTAAEISNINDSIANIESGVTTIEDNIGGLQVQVAALQGALILIGTINKSTSEIEANLSLLNDRGVELGFSEVKNGYTLVDNQGNDWTFIGELNTWIDLGPSTVAQAGLGNLGVVKSSEENLKIYVDIEGTMLVNGLEEILTNITNRLDNAETSLPKSEETTYSNLAEKIVNNTLSAGKKYLITDYKTVYIQPVTLNLMNDSPVEPLMVTASSANTLEPIAFSPLNPKDIIYYDINNNTARYNWVSATESKGVIYRRIDANNNDLPYDHTQIKFRRWAVAYEDVPQWMAGEHPVGTIARNSGTPDNTLYLCIGDSTENPTTANSNNWIPILNAVAGDNKKYWLNNPDGNLGNGYVVPVLNNDYLDCYTFHNQANNTSIHSGASVWHNQFLEAISSGTRRLLNNVFYFISGSVITGNNFSASATNNTFGNATARNFIGSLFYENTIIGSFYNNTIGTGFFNNIINSFTDNKAGNSFYNNTINHSCAYNTFENRVYANLIANSFWYNHIGAASCNNTIGHNTSLNVIGGAFRNNKLSNNFNTNTVGAYFENNSIGASSRQNHFMNYSKNITTGSSFINNVLNVGSGNFIVGSQVSYLTTSGVNFNGVIKDLTGIASLHNTKNSKTMHQTPAYGVVLTYYDNTNTLVTQIIP